MHISGCSKALPVGVNKRERVTGQVVQNLSLYYDRFIIFPATGIIIYESRAIAPDERTG
jgi:hypothetical protein